MHIISKQFPLKLLHPRNAPDRETHFPRYLTVQIQVEILNLYRGIWVSRFSGFRHIQWNQSYRCNHTHSSYVYVCEYVVMCVCMWTLCHMCVYVDTSPYVCVCVCMWSQTALSVVSFICMWTHAHVYTCGHIVTCVCMKTQPLMPPKNEEIALQTPPNSRFADC